MSKINVLTEETGYPFDRRGERDAVAAGSSGSGRRSELDPEIARRCGVDHVFVGRQRPPKVTGDGHQSDPQQPTIRTYRDRHGNTTTMNTAAINAGRTTQQARDGARRLRPGGRTQEPTKAKQRDDREMQAWVKEIHLRACQRIRQLSQELEKAQTIRAPEPHRAVVEGAALAGPQRTALQRLGRDRASRRACHHLLEPA